jgi:hypothetical protein
MTPRNRHRVVQAIISICVLVWLVWLVWLAAAWMRTTPVAVSWSAVCSTVRSASFASPLLIHPSMRYLFLAFLLALVSMPRIVAPTAPLPPSATDGNSHDGSFHTPVIGHP